MITGAVVSARIKRRAIAALRLLPCLRKVSVVEIIMRQLSDNDLAKLLDKDIFHKIGDAADSLGMECYVVGGYVRDLFLERPSNDIDVVVVGYVRRYCERW